jgi:hypothetical protein
MVYTFVDDTTSPEVRAKLQEELDFRDAYYRDNGHHWVGTTWPRPPPTLWMIRPSFVGEEIVIELSEDPLSEQHHCSEADVADCLLTDGTAMNPDKTWQSGPNSITLEVISVRPRVFRIKEFLSDFEANYIVQQSRPRHACKRSGGGVASGARVFSTAGS